MRAKIFLLLVSSLALSACNLVTEINNKKNAESKSVTTFVARANNAYLSEEQAMKRSARVSDVDYALTFELTGEESFSATSNIQFNLNDASTPLTVDLDKAIITKLVINGKEVIPNYNNWFITLAAENLLKGKNNVAVSFTRKHSTNGEGLHRFTDPVDNNVYVYSHFEPAAAHQMFALFDQPDLKANFQMTVAAPLNWEVFSAMKETRHQIVSGKHSEVDAGVKSKVIGDKKVWYFDRTLKLSPYNFSLHAGPYHKWQDNTGKYPLRLFSRQSVAKQIVPQDWFNYTHKGLAFFEDYYGIDYPFRKYDQVIVPDFIYGAMENAAAITFGERGFLTNGEMSQKQKQRLATVIMHEMAHQWFGNLVTMKWWNGLWLNESFAAFMATLATAEATEFTHAWRSFYASGKQSAYRQDQQVTTHPIEVPVPSSANAFDNIDAITYSKGASTLKQLRHLLGEVAFRRGIHNYLAKNAYQNATLDDFIESLSSASGKNLDQWKNEWLYKAGVNTIQSSFSCEAGKVTQFNLIQSADESFPTLREQHVQIALFNIDSSNDSSSKSALILNQKVAVTYAGKSTPVEQLIGSQCPDLVYPNYDDWGFVKVNLDSTSFVTAKNNLSKVSDPLLRSMLWQALWDSVRDGQLPLNEFIETAMMNAPLEQDYTLLGQALSQLKNSLAYIQVIYGAEHEYVQSISKNLEQMTWENVLANTNDKNKLRRWFAAYSNAASSEKALMTLADILNGKKVIENLTISQDIRWAIIRQLSRYQHVGIDKLLAQEKLNDKSDTGSKAAIAAEAIRPDMKNKTVWLANIHNIDQPMPYAKLRSAMGSIYPPEQSQLSEITANARIASLVAVDKSHDHVFMRSYARSMLPKSCTEQSVARLAKATNNFTDLSAGTRRALLVAHQDDKRCLMIKSKITHN